jgi:hypothetical protein
MDELEIQMCVADVMRDDVIESVQSVLNMLNHPYESSWRVARGAPFTAEEVRAALQRLMDAGHVTPNAEELDAGVCSSIPREKVGTDYPWSDVWFHLERSGHEAVERWWRDEGKSKYPINE